MPNALDRWAVLSDRNFRVAIGCYVSLGLAAVAGVCAALLHFVR